WEPGPVIEARVSPYGAFSPDGALLALGGEPGFVLLVRTETGEEVGRLFTPDRTRLMPGCFTPDGSRLVALGLESKEYYVWDLRAVRGELRKRGLAWDARPPAPPPPPARPPQPLRITVETAAAPGKRDPEARRDELDALLARDPKDVNA